MYRPDDVPPRTLELEVQLRLDAAKGCVLPHLEMKELLALMEHNALAEPDPRKRKSLRRRVARYWADWLEASRNVRGLAEIERWTPADPPYALDEMIATAQPMMRGTFWSAQSEGGGQTAIDQLRNAIEASSELSEVRGARAFVEWFDRASAGEPVELPGGVVLICLDYEYEPPERQRVVYRGPDEVERTVRVGTVRKWLSEAMSGASDEVRPSERG